MLNALKSLSDPTAYETARYYEGKRTGNYHDIKVSIVSEHEKRFSTLLQNLITTAGSTVLRTSFTYDYQVGQEIYYRGKFYEISNVADDTQDVNPQLLSLLKPQFVARKVMELIGVD